jgi:hypothetical protein
MLFKWGFYVNYLPWLLTITSMTILQACKHPLAIEGEGDIVEVFGSGRGCLLEQFREGNAACTENEVAGDYYVNYQARPRKGWRFARWEGACSPESDFQYCLLEVPGGDVAWWDATYPEVDIPPSKAVFEPVAGNTGYLVGPAIAGVSYQTSTLQVVTGADGSFQYRAGETVRFSIGDTELGKAPGRPQVTVFDLADSPVLTGFEINRALERRQDYSPFLSLPSVVIPNSEDWMEPFHIVVNLTVLFQTLDHDGDPGNGITISQGVAELLNGVRLEFDEPWWEFQSRLELRNLAARANHKQRFSIPHGLVPPARAMSNLYQSLDIEPHTYGKTWERIQEEFGEGNRTINSDYDVAGYLLHREKTFDDGSLLEFDTWQYDSFGNPTYFRSERLDEPASEVWSYDIEGNVIRHESLKGEGGETQVLDTWRYRYDDEGHLAYRELDRGDDGLVDARHKYLYDEEGRLAREEVFISFDNGGTLSFAYSWDYFYDYGEQPARKEQRWGRKQDLVKVLKFQYNPAGSISQTKTYIDGGAKLAQVSRMEYDDQGEIVLFEVDEGGDGTIDHRVNWKHVYEFDSSGRIIGRESDQYDNGTVDTTATYAYHNNGELKQREEHTRFGEVFRMNWSYGDFGYLLGWERDEMGDGIPESLAHYLYDDRGYLERYELDEGANGEAQFSVEWRYNNRGVPKQRIYSDVNEQTLRQTTEQWWYDREGREIQFRQETSEELPEPFPGRSGYVVHYEFNERGEVVGKTQLSDRDDDGMVNRTTRWRYDDRGNLIHYESDGDVEEWWYANPNEAVDYHYDSDNQLIREAIDRGFDGSIDIVKRYRYDTSGKLLSLEEDVDDDGTLDGEERWDYNEAGQVTRYERFNDGQPFSIEERRYNAEGNLIYRSEDWGADGTVEQEVQLDYSPDGGAINVRLVHRDSYDEGGLTEEVIIREYSATGWGHLFLLLPTPDPQDYEYAWYDPL